MIRLRTLGECLIELHGTALSPESDVLFTVLLYLTAERDRRLSRAAVAELFWPDLAPRRARHCLRQVLYRLRALGLEVQAEHEHLVLASAHIAPGFAATPTRERFDLERRAGTLTLGPLLAGYVPDVSPAFHDWFEAHRGHVHFHVRRVLLEKAREHRLRGEWSDVEWLARECLRLDPLNEEATLALAESMVMVGGKAEAIAYLDRYLAEIGGDAANVRLPATVLRRRIAERFPSRRYAGPADRCFVGRADLLATVATSLLRARNGDGGAVLLWGPAGIGKSRLATEVAKMADVEGMRIVRVPCDESAAARPLAVFMDAAPELMAYSGAIGCAPSSLAYLRRLLQFEPTTSATDALDAATLAANIRRAVVDLVDAVSEEIPLLLVVEDAQWADPASWAVLRALVEWSSGKPALFLFTSRTPYATPTRPERTTTRLEVHGLPPLDDESAAELVRNVVGAVGRDMPAEAQAWCIEAGEGNPLFLQELAGHWLETEQTRGTPPSLRVLLEARIARLSAEARRVLQAVVVLGSYASTERLETLLGLEPHLLLGAVDELAAERLIVDQADALAPRHETVASVALAGLQEPARRLLHRQVAKSLQRALSREATVELLANCYEHWLAAGLPEKGCEALVRAIPSLISRGTPERAEELLNRALLLPAPVSKRPAVLRALASLELHQGSLYRAQATLASLTSRSTPSSDPASAQDRIEHVNALWRLANRGDTLIPELEVIAREPTLPDTVRLRAVTLGLAIADNEAEAAAALRLWREAQRISPRSAVAIDAALHARMIYHCSFGDVEQGLEAARELRARIDWTSEPSLANRRLRNASDAERLVGDVVEAIRLLKAAHEHAEAHQQYDICAACADNLATSYVQLSEFSAARKWIVRARDAASRCEDFDSRYDSLSSIAALAIAEGDLGATEEAILRLSELPPQRMSMHRLRKLLTFQTSHELRSADAPVRADLVDQLEEIHQRMRGYSGHDRSTNALCRALLRRGDEKKARSLLSAYINDERRGTIQLLPELRDLSKRLSVRWGSRDT